MIKIRFKNGLSIAGDTWVELKKTVEGLNAEKEAETFVKAFGVVEEIEID